MKSNCKTLCSLKAGECGVVSDIICECSMRRRFQDLGLIRGTRVKNLMQSPFRDISIYMIRGTMIAIRNTDAQNIYLI